MRLLFRSIADRGDLDNERIIFKASANTDVGRYAIFRTSRNEDSATVDVKQTFWFVDKPVKAGDLVVVYTKEGVPTEKALASGTAHFFYWGRKTPLWAKDDVAGVLVEAPQWETFLPDRMVGASRKGEV